MRGGAPEPGGRSDDEQPGGDLFPGMALHRRSVGDAAVLMLEVVPMHEVARPTVGLVEISEAAYGEVGPVLAGGEIPVIRYPFPGDTTASTTYPPVMRLYE